MSSSPAKQQLLILTMYYRPEPNFIVGDVADALSADFDVTVITAHPNYPMGRFYDSVKAPWWPKRSREAQVTVWRLPVIPYHGRSQFLRFVHYLSFTLWAVLLAPVVGGRPAVVWVYQTPFTNALSALWFKVVRHARLVYTAADLWPEALLASQVSRPGPVIRALFAFSRWINHHADYIIASTRGTAQRYMADGYPSDRLEVVPVWVEGVDAPSTQSQGERESVGIVYCGNLGPAQRIDTLVRAAALLYDEGASLRVDLYGSGSEEESLRALAAALPAPNVRFHGRVTPADAFAVSNRALAQVVSLQPTPLFAMTVPSKLIFSFAAGTPILAGLPGESAELAAASGGSIAFDAQDPSSLAAGIRRLLGMSPEIRRAMGTATRAFYEAHFAKARLLDRYRILLSGKVTTAAHQQSRPHTAERPTASWSQ